MKLHHAPGACSLAVHIALREVGVPFEGMAVDLARHRAADSTRQAFKDTLAARFAERALPLTPYPHLKAYLHRVSQRPRVQDALRAEGLAR